MNNPFGFNDGGFLPMFELFGKGPQPQPTYTLVVDLHMDGTNLKIDLPYEYTSETNALTARSIFADFGPHSFAEFAPAVKDLKGNYQLGIYVKTHAKPNNAGRPIY